MEFWILNENFESIAIVDSVESLLWTDRYCGYGDFQIYAGFDSELFSNTEQDYYAYLRGSDHMMIIDTRDIATKIQTGSHLTVEGVSLEHILTRRILWTQTRLSGSLEGQIKKVLDANVINPSIAARKIPNFRFVYSNDPVIQALTIEATYTGYTLYELINEICLDYGLGWQVTLNWSDKYFEFKLYSTTDRSYDNADNNAFVVFSPNFENLLDSNYHESKRDYKTVALVAGEEEGVGKQRRTTVVDLTNETGLARREMFVDARDLQSELEDGSTMSDADYIKTLQSRGKSKLAECEDAAYFEGEVEATQTFVYGVDFFLGDTVQVRNEYGIEAKSRIQEIIFTQDDSGYSVIPTFSMV